MEFLHYYLLDFEFQSKIKGIIKLFGMNIMGKILYKGAHSDPGSADLRHAHVAASMMFKQEELEIKRTQITDNSVSDNNIVLNVDEDYKVVNQDIPEIIT